jgi:predicted TIM-barrel fold metal-dependent hydrolase
MQLHWHANSQYRFAAKPDLMKDKTFRRNMARVVERGLAFDLQVFAGQMDDAAELAAEFPTAIFILQHAGMLEDVSPKGWDKWRAGMVKLAAQSNVVSKLSGLGTFIHKVDTKLIADIAHVTISLFGAERCLFGSNFPIEKLWSSYGELIRAYRVTLAEYPFDTQEKIFSGTAKRVYRL